MIAEIYGKISTFSTNLSERSEDNLTGNIFGTLRYLPEEKWIKTIFNKLVYSKDSSIKLDLNLLKNETPIFKFWERDNEFGEIDLLIEIGNYVIGIEVKYLSGLSSDDDSENYNESINQLNRYSEMLKFRFKNRNKILIFLAPISIGMPIFENAISRNLCKGIEFAFLSWEDVYKSIRDLMAIISDKYQLLILNDIKEYLEKKGFDPFLGFKNGLKDDCSINELSYIYMSNNIYNWDYEICIDDEGGYVYG